MCVIMFVWNLRTTELLCSLLCAAKVVSGKSAAGGMKSVSILHKSTKKREAMTSLIQVVKVQQVGVTAVIEGHPTSRRVLPHIGMRSHFA